MSPPGERPPCAACTRFYRRCMPWCVFAPYFPPDNPGRFAAVQSAFRSSYVAELLRELPLDRRAHAVDLLVDRAMALRGRRQNPRQVKATLDAVRERVGTQASPARTVPSSSAAACERLQRGCTPECVFAAHFPPSDDPGRFDAVHEAFGAENVAGILGGLPPDQRRHAVAALVYAARARLLDPVLGHVAAVPGLHARLRQVRDQCAAAEEELMRRAWAGADAAGTVTALREKIMEKMAREMAHAKQLAAFVEAAMEPAALSLVQQRSPAQEQTATATVGGCGPCVLKADDRDGDPSSTQWSAWVAAAPRKVVVLVDAQQLAAARQQSRMARQARAGAHAGPTGSISGVAVAILPPESAEVAPSLIQHQPPSQAQTEVATVGVRDPGLPSADDQGDEPSRGSV